MLIMRPMREKGKPGVEESFRGGWIRGREGTRVSASKKKFSDS